MKYRGTKKFKKRKNKSLKRRKMQGGNKPKRLFNLDLHISVIEDVKSIVSQLYGNNVEITNWSVSNHNHYIGKAGTDVKHVNQSTWRDIDMDMIKRFQDEYDTMLSTYDGFIVTHTPVFAMLYEKYNKPIIVVNSCRYDQPFCWNKNTKMLEAFNTSLQRMQASKQLIFISNNLADQEYVKERAGVDSIYIPSLCQYTNAKYNPKHNSYVVFENKVKDRFPSSDKIVNRPTDYTFANLFEYSGIIHMPYDISTMASFEQYFAGMPLFFPTKEFYKKLIKNNEIELISRYDKEGEILPDEEIEKWLKNADYYNFKYINYYSSFEDCVSKVEAFKDTDKDARLQHIEGVKKDTLDKWKKIFDEHIINKQSGGGEHTCKYVSTRGVLKSCDIHLTKFTDIHSCNFDSDYNMDSNHTIPTIYMRFDCVPAFIKRLDSITKRIVLVLGDGDQTFPEDFFKTDDEFKRFIEQDKICHIFSINTNKQHPKLTTYPIGINYHTLADKSTDWGPQMTPGAQDAELEEIRSKMPTERLPMCYSNFHFHMGNDRRYTGDRRQAKKLIPADCIYYEQTEVSRKQTWINQTQYAFVACPHGNGLDCHRQWEAIILGCIPIVKKSSIDSNYTDLPVLIVNEWSDINKDLLHKTMNEFKKKSFKLDKLTLKYWMDVINSKRK
jgi:hypothetical protein